MNIESNPVSSQRRGPWPFATAAIACLAVFFAPAGQAGSTAGASLKEVTAAGQKWQPDAVLTHVSTLTAGPDGTAREWLYNFYSAKGRKSAIVTARPGKVEIEPDVRTTSTRPIAAPFLDSDKAIEAARKHGLKVEKSAGMGLVHGGQATGSAQLYWSVTVMKDDGFSAVTLDGRNGALIKRDDVKLK